MITNSSPEASQNCIVLRNQSVNIKELVHHMAGEWWEYLSCKLEKGVLMSFIESWDHKWPI